MSEEQAASEGPNEPQRAYRGPDRRKRATRRFSIYSLWGGKRRAIRRVEEQRGAFVDVYSTRLWLVVMWIVLMNVADSFFTIVHLQSGGTEVNPIADVLLRAGLTRFVIFKSALVGLALLVLCVHKNFKIARIGIWTAAGAYTLLIAYHIALFL